MEHMDLYMFRCLPYYYLFYDTLRVYYIFALTKVISTVVGHSHFSWTDVKGEDVQDTEYEPRTSAIN
jgi:hypothetical protein